MIIPTPYWVSYSDLVQMTGASYVLVPTTMEAGFKMTPAQLRAAVTPRSKLLMLNSPSNPTGTVYTRQELEALADVVLETGLSVLSDEIYEKLVFGDGRSRPVSRRCGRSWPSASSRSAGRARPTP